MNAKLQINSDRQNHKFQTVWNFDNWALALVCCLVFIIFRSAGAHAAETYNFHASFSNKTETTFTLPFDIIEDIAEIDLGADGTSELLIGSPKGEEPRVYIIRQDGSVINSWLAYDPSFKGGVSVASGNLDADAAPEIITAPSSGGGPHIRVFDGFGNPKITPGFFADNQNYRGTLLVDLIKNGNKSLDIVSLTYPEQIPTLSIFSANGTELHKTFLPKTLEKANSISRIDLGGDGVDEILVLAQENQEQNVFLFRKEGSLINKFRIQTPGIFVASSSPKTDEQGEDITISYEREGRIQKYDGHGNKISESFGKEESAGYYSVAIKVSGINETLEIQKRAKSIEAQGKTIVIDLSDQTLSYYKNGFRIATFPTSTGAWGYKTPLGEHKILNKADIAYSKTYGLYMPYWMAFTHKGHGIHELPYWPSGYREGEGHLGTAVSHGCVRLGIGTAKELYDWAEIGTMVIVRE